MSFKTYSDLVNRIEEWLVRPDLTAEIPDFIRLCEVDVGRRLGWRFTNTEFSGTLVADQEYLDLPTDTAWIEAFRIDGYDPGPQWVPIVGAQKFIDLKRSVTSQTYPRGARHVGQRLYMTPIPQSAYTYTLWYQQTITPLSDAVTSNWLLANGFDCLLYGSLVHAADFIGDEQRSDRWESKFESKLFELRKLEFRARTGGGPLRMQSDTDPGTHPRRI